MRKHLKTESLLLDASHPRLERVTTTTAAWVEHASYLSPISLFLVDFYRPTRGLTLLAPVTGQTGFSGVEASSRLGFLFFWGGGGNADPRVDPFTNGSPHGSERLE